MVLSLIKVLLKHDIHSTVYERAEESVALYIKLIWVEAVQLNVQLNIAEIGLSLLVS